MNIRAVFCAAFIALTTILGSLRPAQAHSRRHRDVLASAVPALTARREGTRLYLVEGKERLLLQNKADAQSPLPRGPQSFALSNGYVIALSGSNVLVSKNGKTVGTIALMKKRTQWLADDKFWGNHDEANKMRYMQGDGADFQLFLTDVIPEKDGVIGILNWQDQGGSWKSVTVQRLVRIHAAPAPTLDTIRRLNHILIDDAYVEATPPRLFTWDKRLLLYEITGDQYPDSDKDAQSCLMEITSNGKDKQSVANLPRHLRPLGVIAKRWLLLGTFEAEKSLPIQVYDLRTAKTITLPKSVQSGHSDIGLGYPDNIVLPQDGNHILIKSEGSDDKKHNILVSIPDGKLVSLSATPYNSAAFIWRNKVVFLDAQLIRVYSADTGKLIKTLPRPKS